VKKSEKEAKGAKSNQLVGLLSGQLDLASGFVGRKWPLLAVFSLVFAVCRLESGA